MTHEPTARRKMKNCDIVDTSPRVVEYFSALASDYQTGSARFPWAWARAHERAAIRSLLGDIAGADVLELGAGSGFYTRELIRCGAHHVWAVDLSAVMLTALPAGPVTAIVGDAGTVRLERRFPVLLCAGMLEFVPRPAAVLANAAVHAEAGARFILLVPRANVPGHLYRRFHRAHGLSIHLFDREWFAAQTPGSGWRIDTIVRVFPFSLAVRLHRT
jgi:SAM-dependent methyltransferase